VAGLFERAPARAKRHRPPWRCPLRGLIVPASPPPRGPEELARILRTRSQNTTRLQIIVTDTFSSGARQWNVNEAEDY